MAVTTQLYGAYNARRQVAIDYAKTTLGKDIGDVNLVIIPAESGIECGTAGGQRTVSPFNMVRTPP